VNKENYNITAYAIILNLIFLTVIILFSWIMKNRQSMLSSQCNRIYYFIILVLIQAIFNFVIGFYYKNRNNQEIANVLFTCGTFLIILPTYFVFIKSIRLPHIYDCILNLF